MRFNEYKAVPRARVGEPAGRDWPKGSGEHGEWERVASPPSRANQAERSPQLGEGR